METENQLKRKIIKWGIGFLGVMLVMTIASKTIYTFLLPVVSTERIKPGKLETKILSEGKIGYDKLTIDARKVEVKATKEGEIVKCYVTENQMVNAGDPLIKIRGKVDEKALKSEEQTRKEVSINQEAYEREKEENKEKQSQIRTKIADKKKELADVNNSYEIISLQSQIEAKEETVKANEDLFKAGAISENDYNKAKEELKLLNDQKNNQIKSLTEKYETEIGDLEDRLKELESQIKSTDEKMALQETRLMTLETVDSEEVITSPINGVVYEINVAQGASALMNDKLMVIVPADIPITLSFNVNSTQADKIEVEKEVRWKYKDLFKSAIVMKKNYDEKTGDTIVTCEVDEELTKDMIEDYKTYKNVTVEATHSSGNYDFIVSNSAISKEGVSSFIYTIEEQENLFEKKYIVHKIMVTVEKEGDFMSAISGTIHENDTIIKTTTKPLSDEAEVNRE